jgi:hypothetical protein
MNLELRIGRAIVHTASLYGAARYSAWVRRLARARMRKARLRRFAVG